MLSNPKVQAAGFHAAAFQLFEVRLAQTGRAGGILQGFTEAGTQRVCHYRTQLESRQRRQGQRLGGPQESTGESLMQI